MRSHRLVLSIHSGRMRLAALSGNRLTWEATLDLCSDRPTQEEIVALLELRPAAVGSFRWVTLRLYPPFAQCRELHGLPGGASANDATAALHTRPRAWFISAARELRCSRAIPHDSRWFAAAYDADLITEISNVLATAALSVERVELGDADVEAPGEVVHACSIPVRRDMIQARVMRLRRGVLLVAAPVLLGAAVFAPGLHASFELRRARATAARISLSAAELQGTLRRVDSLDRRLSAFERAAGRRTSWIPILGSLAQQLPESTAVLSLRADTVQMVMATLSLPGRNLVLGASKVPAVRRAALSGPVNREVVGGLTLDRSSVVLKLIDTDDRAAPARVAR